MVRNNQVIRAWLLWSNTGCDKLHGMWGQDYLMLSVGQDLPFDSRPLIILLRFLCKIPKSVLIKISLCHQLSTVKMWKSPMKLETMDLERIDGLFDIIELSVTVDLKDIYLAKRSLLNCVIWYWIGRQGYPFIRPYQWQLLHPSLFASVMVI